MLVEIDSDGVAAAALAFHESDATVQLEMINAGKVELEGRWVPELEARAVDDLDRSVIVKGARAIVGPGGFVMTAAASNAPLTNGFVPAQRWYAVELGARTRRATINTHSPLGKPYKVTKMLNRGLPSRQKFGRIAFDAASKIGTELVGIWVRTFVNVYASKLGGEADYGRNID